jgi:hypothetical protein
MKEVKEREAELAKKYRDRAKERRDMESSGNVSNSKTSSESFRAAAPEFNM